MPARIGSYLESFYGMFTASLGGWSPWPTSRFCFIPRHGRKVLRGAAKLADAIRVTLGPKSKSVLIQKKWGAPLVCNDGVTIAKEFSLKDAEENLGAQMLRQAVGAHR